MSVNLWTATAEPFTSQTEERVALHAARAGDDRARVRLIVAYLPALRNAVGRLAPTSHYGRTQIEDAHQAAILGLFEAVAAWDASTGRGLAGLAPYYIKGALSALFDALHSHGVPERTRERYDQVMRAANGDTKVAVALAPDFSLSERAFWDVHRTRNPFTTNETPGALIFGLHESCHDGNDEDMHDQRTEGATATPDAFGAVEDSILSAAALAVLDAAEREVVSLSYGLGTGEPLSVRDVAARVGTSKSSVSRTLANALAKMRVALHAAA